jgi:hypothetical protein
MKQAMRAGDKPRLSAIRMALAAIKQREVDDRVELDDSQVLGVLEKMIKQRRESAVLYRDGKRPDLAEKEEAEVELLTTYLPEPLSEQEIDALIAQTIQATGAHTLRDMGMVMATVKAAAQGRADMGEISARVKARLAGS